jgi:hypothetical protein
MPKVLNKKISGVPRDAIYVGRPTKWGNPFVLGRHGNREQVISKYREYLLSNPSLFADIKELRGKDLVCFCAPEACHADILLEIANKEQDHE